jgi:F1F0 ATPase subunit 2
MSETFGVTLELALNLALDFLVGVFLGVVFFGGLWWTVRKGVSSKNSALWFFCSGLARMSVALLGFYLVSGGRLDRLSFCFFGFIAVRVVVSLVTRFPGRTNYSSRGVSHAPES